ncbi:EamA family transporter [Candidatus Micrarchaeota archaeon]|nr:EamA family transporter [Candidatus Micrarchaeota archaeon]
MITLIWLALALLSAFLTAAVSLLEKKTLMREHSLQFSLLCALLNFFLSIALVYFVDFSALDLGLVLIIYGASWLNVIANWFILKGIRHEELSSITPLMNLSPLVLLLLAAFFLGEKLTALQGGGALLMVIGVYLLETAVYGSPSTLLKFDKTKYVWIAMVGIFLLAFCALADKIVLNALTAISYILLIQVFIAVNYLILFIALERDKFSDILPAARRDWKKLGAISVLTIANRLALASAISITYVSLAITVKRLSTLFSTIAGGALFNEKHLALKVAACGLMVAGVYFVIAQ